MEIIKIALPGIIAILGNLLVYLIVKKRIDKSIEKHKISFTGVFQEKITIYKELLKKIYTIKGIIQQFQYSGKEESGNQCFLEINNFINYYLANQPFLSETMIENLKKIRIEFQDAFDAFYIYHSDPTKGINKSIDTDFVYKKFIDARNKMKNDEPFRDLEKVLVSEMKHDIRIDEL
jgi:hypothetical protein